MDQNHVNDQVYLDLIIRYFSIKSYILSCRSNGDEEKLFDFLFAIEVKNQMPV
jgi:hypothetical protein